MAFFVSNLAFYLQVSCRVPVFEVSQKLSFRWLLPMIAQLGVGLLVFKAGFDHD